MEYPEEGLRPIVVAGIGPGHPDYILPAARQAIERAHILVGGKRALETFGQPHQETRAISRDIGGVLDFIEEKRKQAQVVVLVSGDPGYYSLLDALRRRFPARDIQVIPGISSLQMAFSRIALPWHHARLLSFHGRTPEEAELVYRPGSVLGMLTDGKYTSYTIPDILLSKGWPSSSKLTVFSRLSYPDERVFQTTLGEAKRQAEVGHGILIVEDMEEGE